MSQCRLFSVGVLFLLSVVSVPRGWAQQTLENPTTGGFYSGIGVISGWKCRANGPLTIRFNGGTPIPLAYRNERSDTSEVCGDTNNGFDTIWNWAVLGDGTHTAVVYDNGVEFARSTFEVWTLGEDFVRGASGECRVPDFPMPGETTTFEWNQNTQHMEMVEPTGEWIAVAYGTERSSCRSAYGVSLNASTREAARAEAYSLCLMQASADNLPLGVCHSEERYNAKILDGKLERCLSIYFCEAPPRNGQNVCGLITNSGETPAEAEEATQAECESLGGTTVTKVDIVCPTPAGMVRGSP